MKLVVEVISEFLQDYVYSQFCHVYLDTELVSGVSTETGVVYPGSEGSSSGSVSSTSSLPECHHATHHARTAGQPRFGSRVDDALCKQKIFLVKNLGFENLGKTWYIYWKWTDW